MTNATILLEERKEVTTFLLDEGTITETTVTTPVGESPGYVYSSPLKVYDFVTLSSNSEIGNIAVKKFKATDNLPIFGMVINDPRVKENEMREAGVLVLGHLARFKLAGGLEDIEVNDKIFLSPSGAIADDDGTWYAMHPVDDSDDYNYIEAFMPYEQAETGSTVTGSTSSTGTTSTGATSSTGSTSTGSTGSASTGTTSTGATSSTGTTETGSTSSTGSTSTGSTGSTSTGSTETGTTETGTTSTGTTETGST